MKQTLIFIFLFTLSFIVIYVIDNLKTPKSSGYIIQFSKEVDQDDLNSDDVYRIERVSNDTLYLCYYY